MARTHALIPTPEQLVQRLAQCEQQLSELEATLRKKLSAAERAGALAHVASLTQRRHWYLARIRATRPVEPLGIGVADDITSGDGLR